VRSADRRAFEIRQLADVSHCNLHDYLSRNRQNGYCRSPTAVPLHVTPPFPPALPEAFVTGSSTYPADTRFLTIFQAATIMRVSKRTVYRLVQAGDLEAIMVDRSYRIPYQAVNPQAASTAP
jgi:excisionase family DNA binding protein